MGYDYDLRASFDFKDFKLEGAQNRRIVLVCPYTSFNNRFRKVLGEVDRGVKLDNLSDISLLTYPARVSNCAFFDTSSFGASFLVFVNSCDCLMNKHYKL